MNLLRFSFSMGILLCIISSCTSPQKLYESGEYEKAYKMALRKLEKDKSDIESLEVLRASLQQMLDKGENKLVYDYTIQEFQKGLGNRETREALVIAIDRMLEYENELIVELIASDDAKDWEKALAKIEDVKEMLEYSAPYLDEQFSAEYEQLKRETSEQTDRLYEFYFTRGQERMYLRDSIGLKSYARQAYYDFSKAKKYSLENEQLNQLIKTARTKAIVNYYVEPSTIWMISNSWEVNRIFDDIAGENGFKRVNYNGIMSNKDCTISLNFDSPDIDINTSSRTRDFSEQIIVDYEVETDTSGIETKTPIYETIRGEVEIQEKTKTIELDLNVNITSHTKDCDCSGGRFSASASSTITTYELSGDERAIPSEYKNGYEESFEDEDDLIEEALESLYHKVYNLVW
ncbi:MAG: hypothetical protein MI974_28795 [Chitinophagales bacterium]|nr:hypothetical protein [Chitinophagales bacterium]